MSQSVESRKQRTISFRTSILINVGAKREDKYLQVEE